MFFMELIILRADKGKRYVGCVTFPFLNLTVYDPMVFIFASDLTSNEKLLQNEAEILIFNIFCSKSCGFPAK